jgi:Uma2 family endonuclease
MQFVIKPTSVFSFTDEDFFAFCQANPDLRIERNSKQQLILMPPTGLETSFDNSAILFEVNLWNKKDKSGKVSDSNGGYTLPNGAVYAPDVGWLSLERWEALTAEQKKGFAKVTPNFVIELMSESDTLREAKEKMDEWIANGVQLGWLINPNERKAYIYRETGERIIQEFSQALSGEDVLKGFELNLEEIFGTPTINQNKP